MELIDVVVIGAGQAGLTASYHLQRSGIGHVLLDRGTRPGGAWRERWPSLRLGGVHGIHSLPGSALSETDGARPASEVVPEYFGRYEQELDLPVLRPVKVRAVRDGGERLLVESSAGTWAARAVINATGTWENPFWPHYPGQHLFTGRQLHTAGYRGPEEFRSQHGSGTDVGEHDRCQPRGAGCFPRGAHAACGTEIKIGLSDAVQGPNPL